MVKNRISKLLYLIFALLMLASWASVPGYGQESPDEGFQRELEEGLKKNPKTKAPIKAPTLDELFVELKRETDGAKAKRIARKIWFRWTQSGSETVDLLMNWASIAIKEKDWARASDLLDQVVVLAPQYAEGWNRRATLYFMRKNFGRSIHDIEQVLKLEARHFGALAGLGGILQRLGKSAENDKRALEIWNKVLEIYPANKNAQKAVVELEEKLTGRGI